MRVFSPAAAGPPARGRQRRIGIALAVLAIAAAAVLLAASPRLLVALSSDRDGQALLPVGTLAPGSSVTGGLMLRNEGMLPLRYDLRVQAGHQEMAGGVILRVRRNGGRNYVYQGSLSDRPIPIGYLVPGQSDRVEVTLSAPPGQSTASIPIDDTFVWTGHSPGIDSWWWLLLVALALVAAAFLMPRLLALWARLRRLAPPPFELYWRAPLILAAVILAALVPLSGVSLSTVNSQASNPGNVFAIGTLVLSERSPRGTTCVSVAGTGAAVQDCGAIFQLTNQAPGQPGVARVAIRNAGTVPAGGLTLWALGPCLDGPAGDFHGTGDLCAHVRLSIHDDGHDQCFYPVTAPGGCPLQPSATLASFGRTYTPDRPLHLRPDGLGAGITYSFGLELDPAAGNDLQGLSAVVDFGWQLSQ